MDVNVLDYGANPDGLAINTRFINAAIQDVKRSGGGRVYFPPGVYRTGTIELASNLILELARGAVILGSCDVADYVEDQSIQGSSTQRYYLISAFEKRNILITGQGVIDGSGDAFWESEYIRGGPPAEDISPLLRSVRRPRQPRTVLCYLRSCENVTVEGLTIRNAAAYTFWLIDSQQAVFRGLTVRNDRSGPNTDVFDIDCSEDVHIHDCNVVAGDDCVAIKSDPNRLSPPSQRICQRIIVSHCIFSCTACAVRLGYEGDSPIRDCVFSDLVIHNSRHGINMLSVVPNVPFTTIDHGTKMEQIVFSNIVMRDVGQPFYLWAGNQTPRTGYSGYIRDVTFSTIHATSHGSAYIGGSAIDAISHLTFRDVTLRVEDRPEITSDKRPYPVPDLWGGNRKAGAMVLHHTQDVRFYNVRLSTQQPDVPALTWQKQQGFLIDGQLQPVDNA